MKLLDRLVLNRLVAIVLNFILSLIKVLSPKLGKELEETNPITPVKRRKIFPRTKKENNE